jgi:hypothetical protein
MRTVHIGANWFFASRARMRTSTGPAGIGMRSDSWKLCTRPVPTAAASVVRHSPKIVL